MSGMSEDALPLKDSGDGALAYSQAISLYLALVIGKLANFQSTVCTWDNSYWKCQSSIYETGITDDLGICRGESILYTDRKL